jgi:hypothetical protein
MREQPRGQDTIVTHNANANANANANVISTEPTAKNKTELIKSSQLYSFAYSTYLESILSPAEAEQLQWKQNDKYGGSSRNFCAALLYNTS